MIRRSYPVEVIQWIDDLGELVIESHPVDG